MILNKDAENIYIKLGINMPYNVMTMYYKGIDLYKRMLIDIILSKYKPLNRILLQSDRNYDCKQFMSNKGYIYIK